ncbi:MAG: hypothetical protein Q8M58_07320 [Anaerolineales bacterium]|nr:hypothetical protein [Anaerolineales bacterium]
MCFLIRVTSLSRSKSRMQALPDAGRVRPVNMRMVVVLPAPLGPRKPNTSPWRTAKSTPSTARRGGRSLPAG